MTYPAVLSTTDEVAVELFLNGAIEFTAIPNLVEWVLSKHDPISSPDMGNILEVDDWARKMAYAWLG